MKIKQVMPTLVFSPVETLVVEFEKLGFTKKHHLVEEDKIDLYVMETEGGSQYCLMARPPHGIEGIALGSVIVVDDLEEVTAHFIGRGFTTMTDVLTTAHTKLQILSWATTEKTMCFMQHVKD